MRQKAPCPGCRENGRDNSGNNLNLFPDNPSRGFCHVCQKAFNVDGAQRSEYKMPTIELASIHNYPIQAIPDRGLSYDACSRFGIRVALDEETASKITAHFYPYYVDDEIVGYKKRSLPKDFAAIGKIKGLFGQQQCKKNAKMLCVFEGELDAVSAWEMLRQKGKSYNVVSLPNGANEQGVLDAATRAQLDFFTSHELVVICLDNDGPGQTTAKALAELLISQTKVKMMKLSRKDSNDYLKAGDTDGWWSALLSAQDYVPEAIENGMVEDVNSLLEPIPQGVVLDFLPKLSAKFNGIRPGELTIVLAPPGVGKTTLSGQVVYEILKQHNEPVFGMFLEETAKKTRQRIIAQECGVALNRLRSGSPVDAQKAQWANEHLLSKFEILTNNKTLMTDEALLNKVNFFAKAKGCRFGVLDHISYVIASRSENEERKAIDTLMAKLSQRVEDLGIHMIVVCHIKRKMRDRDKSGDTKYPYWELLSLDDARGSGAFEQYAHNIVGIERQITDPSKENETAMTRIRVFKNREQGSIGTADYLTYDTARGILVPVQDGL